MKHPVSFRHTLKASLKRGALVAAANWPVALIQAVADGLFKLLIAVPLVGGIILATLVIRADADPFAAADWRVVVASIVTSLLTHRVVLAAFLLSLAVVLVGGTLFVVLVKGGTLGVLVRGERAAGPVEVPPLQPEVLATAASFSVELFIDSARALFARYARLGFVLMAIYTASGAAYVGVVAGGNWSEAERWGFTTLVTITFVIWTTFVNLLYLLVQTVIAADDCGVMAAVRHVTAFLRHEARMVAGVCLVILAMVVLATGASLLAFSALGLISLLPFMWLAAVPLQLLAFVLRSLVFQYVGLSSIGAYLTLYREFSSQLLPADAPSDPHPAAVRG